jgi:hypothetical protein
VPELSFTVERAEAGGAAASPQIVFHLRVENATPERIQTIVLQSQIQIETTRRSYTADEKEGLLDLFGASERWGKTLRAMLWTRANVTVPAFERTTVVELPVPCTFDFNVAATKYFHSLKGGEVPLLLLFSGSVFYESELGLRVDQIPWDREAKFRLKTEIWREMMDIYYPNLAWLCLRRDAFERLYAYKVTHGIPTWEQAIERLLPKIEENVPS